MFSPASGSSVTSKSNFPSFHNVCKYVKCPELAIFPFCNSFFSCCRTFAVYVAENTNHLFSTADIIPSTLANLSSLLHRSLSPSSKINISLWCRMITCWFSISHSLPTVDITIWQGCSLYFFRSSSKLIPPIVKITLNLFILLLCSFSSPQHLIVADISNKLCNVWYTCTASSLVGSKITEQVLSCKGYESVIKFLRRMLKNAIVFPVPDLDLATRLP